VTQNILFSVLENTLNEQAVLLTENLKRIVPEALLNAGLPANKDMVDALLLGLLGSVRIALVSNLRTEDFCYHELDSGDGIIESTPCFSIPVAFILEQAELVQQTFSAPFMADIILRNLRQYKEKVLNVYLEPDFIESVKFEDTIKNSKNTTFRWVIQLPDILTSTNALFEPLMGEELGYIVSEYIESALTSSKTDVFDPDAFYTAYAQIGGWPWYVQDGEVDEHCITLRTQLGDGGETYVLYRDNQFEAETQMM
jgi:hypothetical protein